jgi:hypothetical protein
VHIQNVDLQNADHNKELTTFLLKKIVTELGSVYFRFKKFVFSCPVANVCLSKKSASSVHILVWSGWTKQFVTHFIIT